ncbi:MAG: hypothetical protein JO198_04590 [Candidatus Dormibacteraeota bacterium]|nr:hypothetical protein [Candidatus Dormibacteraeota bacterium]
MAADEGKRIGSESFEVLLRSVDRDVPLNGENPVGESSLDEARLWRRIYREVVELEESVLNTIVEHLPLMSREARTEAETTNVPLIRGQLDRFRHRLHLWEARASQLENEFSQSG